MITANDLKTKGVASLDAALQEQREAMITVRGEQKYVVMKIDDYKQLREAELEAAFLESLNDIDSGRFKTQSVETHIKELFD
ncbi:MAG TPA: prevent-host-death protein [Methylophaga sp.]|nr:prevent-host-death protein [Methylophaga sp.]